MGGAEFHATLLTSLFVPARSELEAAHYTHATELYAAVGANLLNPHLEAIHVLLEAREPEACRELPALVAKVARVPVLATGKLHCAPVAKQPRYADFFRYASSELRERVVILANTDVVFDGTLGLIAPSHFDRGDRGFVLSVQPSPLNGLYKRRFGGECVATNRCTLGDYNGFNHGGDSFDAYIFRAPLPQSLDLASVGHFMNMLGAENLAAHALERSGVSLSNPCLFVKAFHWHCTAKTHRGAGRVDKGRAGLYGIMPCWECAGLRAETAPRLAELCAAGRLADLEDKNLRHLFRLPGSNRICCPRGHACDQAEIFRAWLGNRSSLPLCRTAQDTMCVMTWGGEARHVVRR